jgi:hypothetical protein
MLRTEAECFATTWCLLSLILPGFMCLHRDRLLLIKFCLRVKFDVPEAVTEEYCILGYDAA